MHSTALDFNTSNIFTGRMEGLTSSLRIGDTSKGSALPRIREVEIQTAISTLIRCRSSPFWMHTRKKLLGSIDSRLAARVIHSRRRRTRNASWITVSRQSMFQSFYLEVHEKTSSLSISRNPMALPSKSQMSHWSNGKSGDSEFLSILERVQCFTTFTMMAGVSFTA